MNLAALILLQGRVHGTALGLGSRAELPLWQEGALSITVLSAECAMTLMT